MTMIYFSSVKNPLVGSTEHAEQDHRREPTPVMTASYTEPSEGTHPLWGIRCMMPLVGSQGIDALCGFSGYTCPPESAC